MKHSSEDRKKIIKRVMIFAGILVLIFILFLLLCKSVEISDSEAKEIIGKLQKFTVTEEKGDDDPEYIFKYNGEWQLEYMDENEFARIEDSRIPEIFSQVFEEENLGLKAEFCYDFDKEDLNMFFNVDLPEGNLSSITYNLDKDEYTTIVNGERYGLADEFEDRLEGYNLKKILKSDVDHFISSLKANGLTYRDVSRLTYKSIKKNIGSLSEKSEKEKLHYDIDHFEGEMGYYISTSGGSEDSVSLEINDSGNGKINVTFKSITQSGVVSAQGKITGSNIVEADWNKAHFRLEWTEAGQVIVRRTGTTGYMDIDSFTENETYINNSYYQVG